MMILDYEWLDAGLPKGPLSLDEYRKLPDQVRKSIVRKGTLDYEWHVQQTGWWCGPTTAQMILQARGVGVSQQTLASEMGTDEDGTDYVGLMPNPLNKRLNAGFFATYAASLGKEALWDLFTASIDSGFGVGCNIVTVPGKYNPPGYPSYVVWHYVPAFGYRGSGSSREVFCADSANFSGVKSWWVTLDVMHGLIVNQSKGIASAPRTNTNLLGLSDTELSTVATRFRQLGPS